MPVKFGQPMNAGVARGSNEAQRTGGTAARAAPDGAQTPTVQQGEGPPLARRNAGSAGASANRVALPALQRSVSAPSHPETVAAEICGDAISGRLPMVGRYFPNTFTAAAKTAVKGLLPLL